MTNKLHTGLPFRRTYIGLYTQSNLRRISCKLQVTIAMAYWQRATFEMKLRTDSRTALQRRDFRLRLRVAYIPLATETHLFEKW